MLVADHSPTQDTELAGAIGHQINQRTFGRVQYLRVEVADGRVAVHGLAPTYYVKQLALQAVREVMESAPVELNVDVAPGHRPYSQDWDLPVNHS